MAGHCAAVMIAGALAADSGLAGAAVAVGTGAGLIAGGGTGWGTGLGTGLAAALGRLRKGLSFGVIVMGPSVKFFCPWILVVQVAANRGNRCVRHPLNGPDRLRHRPHP